MNAAQRACLAVMAGAVLLFLAWPAYLDHRFAAERDRVSPEQSCGVARYMLDRTTGGMFTAYRAEVDECIRAGR